MSFVTPDQLDRIVDFPISLPETELQRSKSLEVARFVIEEGRCLAVRIAVLHLLRVLTPEVLPVKRNTGLGVACLGIYAGDTIASPILSVVCDAPSVSSINPFVIRKFSVPGTYTVRVVNNTSNVDVAVCATASFRLMDS
jgi:hypothetical protein